jgi:hypothetical protein
MWWKLIDEYAEGNGGRQVVVAVEVDASTSASGAVNKTVSTSLKDWQSQGKIAAD